MVVAAGDVASAPAMTAGEHDRKFPGLNHLAFHAGEKASVDALAHDGQRNGGYEVELVAVTT